MIVQWQASNASAVLLAGALYPPALLARVHPRAEVAPLRPPRRAPVKPKYNMGEIIPDALQPAAWLEVVSFITGTAGALFILGAYVALLRGAMKETSRVYHAMNFVGGMLAAVGALVEALTGSFGSCPLVFLEGAKYADPFLFRCAAHTEPSARPPHTL